MSMPLRRLLPSSRWLLPAALLFILAGSFSVRALDAPSIAPGKADAGFEWSITEGTQFNFGKLGIGAGYMGGGLYLDEKNVRRTGLHASLDIQVDGEPSLFQQPDVHEGQTLEVAGYRILIEKIIPGEKGVVVLRVWGPPDTDK